MISDRTRTVVIAVVTTVWAVNFIAALVPPLQYDSDPAVNAAFMVVVGGLFALGARGGSKSKDNESKKPDETEKSDE